MEDDRERKFFECCTESVLGYFRSKQAFLDFDSEGVPTLRVSKSLTPEVVEKIEDSVYAYLVRVREKTFLFETF